MSEEKCVAVLPNGAEVRCKVSAGRTADIGKARQWKTVDLYILTGKNKTMVCSLDYEDDFGVRLLRNPQFNTYKQI